MILQPRQINGFEIYNDWISPTDCKIVAKAAGQSYTANFFGGKNTYQVVGNFIILIAGWFQGHYTGRKRDLIGVTFDTSAKRWIPASVPLRTPTVYPELLWLKIGSGNDIQGAPPNDPGGFIVFPSIKFNGPGLIYWETETLNSKGALIATEKWQRQINLADGTMGPIQNG